MRLDVYAELERARLIDLCAGLERTRPHTCRLRTGCTTLQRVLQADSAGQAHAGRRVDSGGHRQARRARKVRLKVHGGVAWCRAAGKALHVGDHREDARSALRRPTRHEQLVICVRLPEVDPVLQVCAPIECRIEPLPHPCAECRLVERLPIEQVVREHLYVGLLHQAVRIHIVCKCGAGRLKV